MNNELFLSSCVIPILLNWLMYIRKYWTSLIHV